MSNAINNQNINSAIPPVTTDNKLDISSASKPLSPTAVISKPNKLRLIFFLGLISIILLISFIFINNIIKSQNTAGLNSQAKKLAVDCSLSEKDAVSYLVDEKVLSLWAKDQNVATPTFIKTSNTCLTLQAKVRFLRDKLFKISKEEYKTGKTIVINFGHYLPGGLFQIQSEDERKKNYEGEKQYAENLSKSIYNDLKENKMTFDEAVAKVKNDKKVGSDTWYSTDFQSGLFTTDDYLNYNGMLKFAEVREKIDSVEEGSFSEPFLQSVSTRMGSGPKQPARFIIVKVEKSNKGFSGTFEQLLKITREHYKAESI